MFTIGQIQAQLEPHVGKPNLEFKFKTPIQVWLILCRLGLKIKHESSLENPTEFTNLRRYLGVQHQWVRLCYDITQAWSKWHKTKSGRNLNFACPSMSSNLITFGSKPWEPKPG